MNAKRLTFTGEKQAEIESVDIQKNIKNNVLIKNLYSALSRGTESLVYHAKVPETEYERMRCPHQAGSFAFPISYGYCSVGCIEELGEGVTDFKVGDTVFVLHPHQDRFWADPQFCTLVPKGISPRSAVLSANLETALNANWDAELLPDSNTAIIGAGVVGLLTAYIAKKLTGTTPLIIDINPKRAAIAQALGLRFSLPTEGLGQFSHIFNTSASAKGLQYALDIADFEAKIVEMSWYGANSVTLDLGGAFHSRRLQIISSQVGHISPSKRDTVTHAERMKEAMSYLNDTVLEILLEEDLEFVTLPSHLSNIFSSASDTLCNVIKYP